MKPADEVARAFCENIGNHFGEKPTEVEIQRFGELITAFRREGAEWMRGRAAKLVADSICDAEIWNHFIGDSKILVNAIHALPIEEENG